MARKTYRKRVPGEKRTPWGGLPQLIVELSALPEFGGKKCSHTMAYKLCYGEVVSARLEAAKKEAERRLQGLAA